MAFQTWSAVKDPDEIKDYTITWTDLLEGDTISTSVWDIPTGLTEPTASSNTSTVSKIWIGGGTSGQSYNVSNSITTAGGRTYNRTIILVVRSL